MDNSTSTRQNSDSNKTNNVDNNSNIIIKNEEVSRSESSKSVRTGSSRSSSTYSRSTRSRRKKDNKRNSPNDDDLVKCSTPENGVNVKLVPFKSDSRLNMTDIIEPNNANNNNVKNTNVIDSSKADGRLVKAPKGELKPMRTLANVKSLSYSEIQMNAAATATAAKYGSKSVAPGNQRLVRQPTQDEFNKEKLKSKSANMKDTLNYAIVHFSKNCALGSANAADVSSAKHMMLNKCNILVDTSKARSNSDVLRRCLTELGWQECTTGGHHTYCDIIWQSCTSHENKENVHSNNSHYSSNIRINKFPYMNHLLRKGPLTQSLNSMRSLFENEFNFYPRTWFLPEQFKDFSDDCRYIHDKQLKSKSHLTTFIVKPNDGSQGEGIYLIKNPNQFFQFNTNKTYIVQEYIHNPFLIDGLKSDLRIYVLILSIKPLEIYIYDEGLVRFATMDYQLPDEKNLNQIFMHLTNYSLNKKNTSYNFVATEETAEQHQQQQQQQQGADFDSCGQGSKRKLTKIYNYMNKRGFNVNKIRAEIDDLVIKTIFSLLPEMKVETSFELINSKNRASCFQIIGFDILLREDLKPMLLEVNCNPSLRIDFEIETKQGTYSLLSPIDLEIKKPLVLETLKLVAPKKKLEIIEKMERSEKKKLKEEKLRELLVKQRIEQRIMSAKRKIKLDMDKCPLLSKPSELYKKSKLKLETMSDSQLINNTCDIKTLNYSLNNETDSYDLKSTHKSNHGHSPGLRLIYPSNKVYLYRHLYLQEHIADIFLCFTLFDRSKYMNHFQFRNFIRNCNIIGEKLSADNLDIIFIDLCKKWENFNKKRNEPNRGLCYQGFVECFFKIAKIFFNQTSQELNIKYLIYHCKNFLNLSGFKSNEFFNLDVNEIGDFKEEVPVSTSSLDSAGRADSTLKLTNTTSSANLRNLVSTKEEPAQQRTKLLTRTNTPPDVIDEQQDEIDQQQTDNTLAEFKFASQFPDDSNLNFQKLVKHQRLDKRKSFFPMFF